MSHLHRVLRQLIPLVVLLLTAGVIGAQAPERRAGVVVQFSDGVLQTYCVDLGPNGQATGEAALRATGLDLTVDVVAGRGAAVCSIVDEGCFFPDEACFCDCPLQDGTDCNYWSYSRLTNGQWVYSQQGASTTTVVGGSVEGWTYGPGTQSSGAVPQENPTFAEICAANAGTPTPTPTPTNTPLPTATYTQVPFVPLQPSETPTASPLPTLTRTPAPSPTRVGASPTPAPTRTGAANTPASPTPMPSPTRPAAASPTVTVLPARAPTRAAAASPVATNTPAPVGVANTPVPNPTVTNPPGAVAPVAPGGSSTPGPAAATRPATGAYLPVVRRGDPPTRTPGADETPPAVAVVATRPPVAPAEPGVTPPVAMPSRATIARGADPATTYPWFVLMALALGAGWVTLRRARRRRR